MIFISMRTEISINELEKVLRNSYGEYQRAAASWQKLSEDAIGHIDLNKNNPGLVWYRSAAWAVEGLLKEFGLDPK